jgi:hypothetical protein
VNFPPRMLLAASLLLGGGSGLSAQSGEFPPIVGAASFPHAPPLAAADGAPAAAPAVPGRVFAPAETIAIVGDQHILAGDLLGEINQMLAPYIGKAPEDELEAQRQILMKQLLPSVVENKILYLEFLRHIPPQRLPEVRKKLDEEFDAEKLERALERAKVNSPQELDAILRRFGSSLEKQRRSHMEQKLGRAMLGKEIDYNPEVTHEEMLAYYRAHAAEFDVVGQARWEQLTVRFENHPSKQAAWEKIAGMGNEVLRGAPLSAVAKRHSESPTAAEGGQYDWVTRGSLASTQLDAAIFTLPTGKLSPIIEDNRGFHIVRVLERTEDSRVDFVQAQEQIKEKLRKEKIQAQVMAYVENLKAKTRVWTVFDDETAVAEQSATSPRPRSR